MLKSTRYFAKATRSALPFVSKACFSEAAAAPVVSVQLVKKLRESTGSPLMECKKALGSVLADGPMEDSAAMTAAIEWLRKKGTALAANKSSRSAKEGVVIVGVSKDKKTGAVIEVNCETDFVSRNSTFLAYAVRTTIAALENNASLPATADAAFNYSLTNVEALKLCALPEGPAAMPSSPAAAGNNVAQEGVDVVNNVRENVRLRRAASVAVPAGSSGFVTSYTHNELPAPEELRAYLDSVLAQGYEIRFGGAAAVAAVSVAPGADTTEASLTDLAKKVAMQAVAGRPEFLTRANVPAAVVAKEREIIESASDTAGKDPKIVERLLEGKLNKYFEAAVLVDQTFLITNDTKRPKVGELLSKHAAAPAITQLARFARGEGAEAEEEAAAAAAAAAPAV
jgi:elongation factor Ts